MEFIFKKITKNVIKYKNNNYKFISGLTVVFSIKNK